MSLCARCRTESDRWLDTTPSTLLPRISIAHGSGAPYDASPAGVRDNTHARYEQWRRTVNHQRQLIREQCRSEQHTAPEQLDLLDELDLHFTAARSTTPVDLGHGIVLTAPWMTT